MVAPNLLGENKSTTAPNLLKNTEPTPAPPPTPKPSIINVDTVDMSDEPKATSPQTKAPTSPGGAFYQHGNAPIIAMQQALINLSKEMVSHGVHDVADRTTPKDEHVNGSNAFMNFLVNNYVNKAKVSGKTLSTTKPDVNINDAKENDNIKAIFDTMTRIGAPGSQQRPDGVWGPLTNNALKQVYALSHTMLELKKDMGLSISGYSESDLAAFHNAIPDDIKSVKDINTKVSMAAIATTSLNKIRNFYDNFRETVLNNPNFHAHIVQNKPLMIDKVKRDKIELSDYEMKLYEQHKATPFDIKINGKLATLMPYDLSSMEAFKKFCARTVAFSEADRALINANDKGAINSFLSQVVSALQEKGE